jgi:ABC-type multidrug transport system fused ATPase/permease subunit
MPWPQIVNHTTLVSQSPFLFKDTLRGNLLYGLSGSERQTVTDKMLWDSLRLVNLEDTIKVLPNGLESEFNPIQTNLSGGQIQRLVIARAILRRPNVLMLDEATAAIDGATERDISTRLIAASRHDGTILIAVTHRLRWLGLYDEVWFVENGRLELAGSHTDLLTRPRYRQFTSTEDGE